MAGAGAAAAAALRVQNLIMVGGDVEVCSQVSLGGVEDIGGQGRAVGVLCDAQAGVVVVEQGW